MSSTCDGLRVRLTRDLPFNRTNTDEKGERGVFTIPTGTVCSIVDNDETRAYTERAKSRGDDLIPVNLEGMIRYVSRSSLEVVRDG